MFIFLSLLIISSATILTFVGLIIVYFMPNGELARIYTETDNVILNMDN